jgi:acetyl coenzyme A synthetase (ADP forming)-like protein
MIEKFEGDVALKDGSLVHVRRATADDSPRLAEFLEGISASTLSSRFQGGVRRLQEQLDEITPSSTRFTLVAEREHRIIAEADYVPAESSAADAGVLVTDTFHRKGLGTILLAQLSQAAADSGITRFTITTPATAHYRLNFVEEMGYPVHVGTAPGFVRVTFPTSMTPTGLRAFERGEAVASATAVSRFLNAKSVAVIGASRDKSSIGGALFANIMEGGFKGPVYPVNREATYVQSVTAYKSVLDCPGKVDLAFVVVPARFVSATVRECAAKGVPAIVVIASGFAEVSGDGHALQEELVQICTEAGIRLIGPNCMGIVNTDPAVGLNGQFAPVKPTLGRIGFESQSGALGYAIIDHANNLGLGLSSFVSVGNKADISGNDLIQYWEDDRNTDLILMHIESFGNPRKFARLAHRIARKKPIVAVKSGRSASGFRATQSHTGALVAASDVTVDALFRQSGVIRTDTLEEMFDVAAFLATQPVPRGPRVAIVTNAGGPGILAADACEGLGLTVPELAEGTKRELRSFLLPIAGTRNPVDMTSVASASDYARVISTVSQDPNVDALIVIFIPPIAVRTEDVSSAILQVSERLEGRIPVVATFMAAKGVTGQLSGEKVKIPAYPFPESAARVLSRTVQYGRWLAEPRGRAVHFVDIRKLEAASIVSGALAAGKGWLTPGETDSLLSCYGIRIAKSSNARTPEEAEAAAGTFGGKVVLKAVAPSVIHKTEVGGVSVGLSPDQVAQAAVGMRERLRGKGIEDASFLVQEMIPDAAEMFVGVTNDANFGPLLACGAGGALVELIRDVTVKLTPLTDRDAHQMVRSLKTFPLLEGYRGGQARDVKALEDVILRLSELVEDLPEVDELDLNPVMVLSANKGAVVVDARVHVIQGAPGLPLGAKK